ncbi:AAA domain-containing protein [Phaeodactylibacter xiamenensis]|uniref:AAA domain-containing protein n=1 Tax=Phaeodactylibacter xiamenensis TaxID=1524460 RepID=UPI003BAC34ED
MNHIEDIFGNEPIELVIRLYPSSVKAFNSDNPLFLFEELKKQLTETEHDCFFQNLGEGNQKVIIPIESKNCQTEFFISWHETTFSYKTLTKSKYKPVLKEFISLPESDFIQERCALKFIDINEPYRTKDELEHLYKRISELEVPVGIDIDKENEIWFKYIDATKKIIEKRQQPFDIRRYYSVKPIGGDFEKATRFSFKVDLKIEENKEYKEVEEKLRELDVENPRFDNEGSIYLTTDDIFNALDPVLEKEFQGVVIREKQIGCIVKIIPTNKLETILKNHGVKNVKVYSKDGNNYVTGFRGNRHKLESLCWHYGYKANIYKGKFKVVNHGEDITKNIKINKKHRIFFEDVEYGHILPKPFNNIFSLSKEEFFDLIFFKTTLENIYGKENVIFAVDYVFGKSRNLTNGRSEYATFEKDVKRYLYDLAFSVNYYENSNSIFFEFHSEFDLMKKIDILKSQNIFHLNYNPDGFKYKVKTNIISRKTHLETVRTRIEKLGGVDFEIIAPKQHEETGEWFYPDTKRPKKLLIGTLNRRESNISTLIFTLNTFYKEHKRALKKLLELSDEKAPIRNVEPNLIGDAVKIDWLREAVGKLTNPTDKPNGKPVNQKLKDFIFDSSKAEPIYDELKITKGSTFWREVENSKLSKTLNDSQIKAVLAAVHSTDLCLLQGPPGTGKTTVISEIIWQQVRQNATNSNGYKILLTSETNLAVDNALEKLIGENTTIVKPLRFGKSAKFEEEGKKYSIDRIMKWVDENYNIDSDYENEQLENDEDEIEEAAVEDLSNNAVQKWMLSIGNRAQKRADSKYAEILKDWHKDLALPTTEVKTLFKDKYFKYANVIGSTCSSCGSPRFRRDYDTMFNASFNGKAAKEVIYLMETYPNSGKIWRLLNEELGIDTASTDRSDFPAIKQTLADKLNIYFDTVIMDEASKATPPEMVLPLCFGKKSIIIGDHKQLPPMINDREFKEVLIEEAEDEKLADEIGHNYLKESQFKRLIVNPKVSPTIRATFDVQYRMHSQIGALIQQFYPELENGLVCGIKTEEDVKDLNNKASRYHGLYHEGFIKPHKHVIWVDVPEPEAKDGTSRVNETEVETVKQVLNYLKNSDGYEDFQNHWEKEIDTDKRLQEQEIGIISFYGKQVRKLNEVSKYAQKELDMKIRLKTVDKFQGMERNIIIVSTVRSDKIIDLGTGEAIPNVRGREGRNYSPWGFADSPERLNVALSRARRLLIVVGNIMHFANFRNKDGEAIYLNVINQIPPENIINYKTLIKYQ